jgi:hypothetical protein
MQRKHATLTGVAFTEAASDAVRIFYVRKDCDVLGGSLKRGELLVVSAGAKDESLRKALLDNTIVPPAALDVEAGGL